VEELGSDSTSAARKLCQRTWFKQGRVGRCCTWRRLCAPDTGAGMSPVSSGKWAKRGCSASQAASRQRWRKLGDPRTSGLIADFWLASVIRSIGHLCSGEAWLRDA
jgi:hypothetical protein